MQLYRNHSGYPKVNAQQNLCGRTHYVDDATLRFHKSRVLSARHVDEGLLFAIVTSDALDMHNSKRGYRFVIFDVFGTVLERPKLEEAFTSSKRATEAMWKALNAINAKQHTLEAIERQRRQYNVELNNFASKVAALSQKQAA